MNLNEERKRFRKSFVRPLIFIAVLWCVKIVEEVFGLNFSSFGLLPRDFLGLRGILFSPFIHGDFEHLWANSAALFTLGFFTLYFYPKVALKLILYSFILSNSLLWIGGRENFHIGASGIVYALASFLLASGFISKYYRLIAVSLIVVFLYGSFIWGILPINPEISWEGHLFGAISGFIFAIYYRKEAPKRPKYKWEDDRSEEDHYIDYSYKPPKTVKPNLIELIKKTRDKNLEKFKSRIK